MIRDWLSARVIGSPWPAGMHNRTYWPGMQEQRAKASRATPSCSCTPRLHHKVWSDRCTESFEGGTGHSQKDSKMGVDVRWSCVTVPMVVTLVLCSRAGALRYPPERHAMYTRGSQGLDLVGDTPDWPTPDCNGTVCCRHLIFIHFV